MRRWSLCGLILAGSVVPWLSGAELNATTAEWPQFRGPRRDNVSMDTGLLPQWPSEGPPLLWKADHLGQGFSSVSVAAGRVYTMGDGPSGESKEECVIALDQTTGTELWKAKVGEPWDRDPNGYHGSRSTPTVDGELLYALSPHGDLVCLTASTGQERWRKNLPKDFGGKRGGWGYAESPLVDGDKLVCTPGGKEATMVALDKKTGDVLWKGVVPGGVVAGYASIVIAEVGGLRQYVQLTQGGVIGIAAEDGKFLWKYDKLAPNTANIPTCIVRVDLVFCSAGYGKGGALLRLVPDAGGIKAEEVYFQKELANKHGGLVLVGDYLYGDRDASGRPFCADFMTGKLQWQKQERTQGSGSASLTYADGHLYIRYDNGYVALIEATPQGYKEKSIFKIPNSDRSSWAHPVVIGGRLYLREKDVLWCYNVGAS